MKKLKNTEDKSNTMVVVFMISLALGIRQMSMTMVMPFLSTYCKDLIGYTPVLAGVVVGIFGLMQAILQIPFGMWSDRFGNKKMIGIGLSFVSVGLVVAFFAKTIWTLILARGLQGSGAIIAVGYAWVAGITKKEEQVKAMSILGAFVSAAAAFAFAAGPLLRKIMSVRYMFLLCAILLFLNELYILFYIRDDSNPKLKEEIIITRMGDKKEGITSSKEYIKELLHDFSFIKWNLIAFFNNFMMMSFFYAVPLYIVKTFNEEEMWKIFVPAIIVAIVVMKIVVRWAENNREDKVFLINFLLLIVSFILILIHTTFFYLLISTTIFMSAYVSLATVVATCVNQNVRKECRGTANGIFNAFQYIGSFMGAIITGAMWGKYEKSIWYLLIILCFIAIGIILLGKRKIQNLQK